MKKLFAILTLCTILIACSEKKETAASIAKEWCDLNSKVARAESAESKAAATEARTKYENQIEAKYKDNEAFMKEVEEEVEKCEDASEGKE